MTVCPLLSTTKAKHIVKSWSPEPMCSKYCTQGLFCVSWCWSISFVLVGAYSAVPPPASIQKAPAALAGNKAKDSDSSDSSDDSSDEEENKKVAGKRSQICFKLEVSMLLKGISNSTVILAAKSAPVKTTAAKPGVPKPAAKKPESSSESSGSD